MPIIKYIEASGVEHLVNAHCGVSVMQAAVDHAVPGIDGDCGGAMACGTCQVYVDQGWIDRTGRAQEPMELTMLDLSCSAQPTSRLSCQIIIDDTLDGLVVRLPQGQY